jgi:hypothetical protein
MLAAAPSSTHPLRATPRTGAHHLAAAVILSRPHTAIYGVQWQVVHKSGALSRLYHAGAAFHCSRPRASQPDQCHCQWLQPNTGGMLVADMQQFQKSKQVTWITSRRVVSAPGCLLQLGAAPLISPPQPCFCHPASTRCHGHALGRTLAARSPASFCLTRG